MDKFRLAVNPMRHNDNSEIFIVHMLDPFSIIRCSRGHVDGFKIFTHYQFDNKGDMELWTLSIYHFFTADMLEKPEDRAVKLLDRAWRWYRAYIENHNLQKNTGYEPKIPGRKPEGGLD